MNLETSQKIFDEWLERSNLIHPMAVITGTTLRRRFSYYRARSFCFRLSDQDFWLMGSCTINQPYLQIIKEGDRMERLDIASYQDLVKIQDWVREMDPSQGEQRSTFPVGDWLGYRDWLDYRREWTAVVKTLRLVLHDWRPHPYPHVNFQQDRSAVYLFDGAGTLDNRLFLQFHKLGPPSILIASYAGILKHVIHWIQDEVLPYHRDIK